MPAEAEAKASLAKDCTVDAIRVRGPGGQHRNRRNTGIRLVHRPSGVQVTATRQRRQVLNRAQAYADLWERLRLEAEEPKPRKATKTPARVKEERLLHKKRRANVKAMRQKPSRDD